MELLTSGSTLHEDEADIVVQENETLFDSRKFKAMNTDDSKLGSLMEDQFLSLLHTWPIRNA